MAKLFLHHEPHITHAYTIILTTADLEIFVATLHTQL